MSWKWQGAAWWLFLPVLLGVAAIAVACFATPFHRRYLLPEGYGGHELVHFFLPVVTAVYVFWLMTWPSVRADRLIFVLLAGFALGNLYIAGEEQSWGQHFFNWSTPEYWTAVNRQRETNLHNVSGWFNQKPRALLELGIFVLGCLAALPRDSAILRRLDRVRLLIPTYQFVPVAAVATVMKFTAEGDMLERHVEIFRDTRMSEVHETFLVLALFYYIIIVGRKIRSRGAGEPL